MKPSDLQRLILSYNKEASYVIQTYLISTLNNNDMARLVFSMDAAKLNPIDVQTDDVLYEAMRYSQLDTLGHN